MMDIYVGIGVVLLVIAIFGMLATSMLGIKGRSYEEALAEQREVTNELLGISSQSYQKNKTKTKKMKKIVKKNKKNQLDDVTNPGIYKNEFTRSTPQLKHHVEFKEAELIPEDEDPSKKKFQNAYNKNEVRPNLVHRQETENIEILAVNKLLSTTNQEPANHFQPTHPTGDLELLQSDDIKKSKETKLSKGNKSLPSDQHYTEADKKDTKKSTKQMSKIGVERSIEKQTTITSESKQLIIQPTIIEEAISINTNVHFPTPTIIKENKKKINATGNKHLVQQSNGVASMSSLFPLVRNAELSRSEVQTFIDMLLNKQLEAPSVLDEWSEGRADPLQKVKRQLLEREKQLESEQDAKVSLQQKLIKLREELNLERIQCTQRTKLWKEALHAQQQATQHHSQQMQIQIHEGHKFREDYTALQRQYKLLEIRSTKMTEVEEARVKKLLSENQEMQAVIGQLRKDVLNLTEQLRHISDKSQLALTELNTAGMDLVRKDDLIRDLEQSRVNMEHQHKTDFNQMQSHLQQQNEEIRRYEFNNDEVQKQRNDTERLIAQLRNELVQTQEQSIHGALATSEAHQVEMRKLQNELSSFRSQLNAAVREHKQVIGNLQSELDRQREKNNALRERNWKVVEALNVAETRSKPCANDEKDKASAVNDILFYRNFVQRLFPTLNLPNDLPTEDILTQATLAVQTLFDDLDRSKTTEVQLQTKIERLQEAIIDSDTTLRHLYEKIQHEEIDWRSKLNEKDAEINRLQPEPQILENTRNSCSSINGSAPDYEETNGN